MLGITTVAAPETLTIFRRASTGRDAYGMSTGPEVEVPVRGCHWWPLESAEAEQGRDTAVTRYRLIAPAGTDIRASDEVRLDDDPLWPSDRWRVDGAPRQHTGLTGSLGGVSVWLEKVQG